MSSYHKRASVSTEAPVEREATKDRKMKLPFAPQRLEEEAAVLFGVGRLSQNYTVHAGVFRRLLPGITLSPNERPVYRSWLVGNASTTMDSSRSEPSLTAQEIQALRAVNDPAVAIADVLHETYCALHPNSQIDVRLFDKANHGIDLVLASIHRPHPNYLQAVVEMYEPVPPTIDPAA